MWCVLLPAVWHPGAGFVCRRHARGAWQRGVLADVDGGPADAMQSGPGPQRRADSCQHSVSVMLP